MVDTHRFKVMKNIEKKQAKGIFVVANDRGLHTRPSTEIVKHAAKYKSDIFLHCQKNMANAKSLLGILMLAASRGTKIEIRAAGTDAQEAVDKILELSRNNFNVRY